MQEASTGFRPANNQWLCRTYRTERRRQDVVGLRPLAGGARLIEVAAELSS